LINDALGRPAPAVRAWTARARQRGQDVVPAQAVEALGARPAQAYGRLADLAQAGPAWRETGAALALLQLKAGRVQAAKASLAEAGSGRDDWLVMWAARLKPLAALRG
jgi:thioredoxin-like negative regulator of GroEL